MHRVVFLAIAVLTSVLVADASARFPARTPAEVVELAVIQETTGRATWAVRTADERYVVELAQRDREVLLHAQIETEQVWVEYRLEGVEFVCFASDVEPLGCRSEKLPGVAELGTLLVLGAIPFANPAFIHHGFGPKVLAKAKVIQTREAGEPVSCLVATVARRARRLCVTSYGFASSVVIGKRLRAVARELSSEVADADLAAPVQVVETEPEPAPAPRLVR